MDSERQINRRSFFKIGAALSGVITAGIIGGYNDNELKRGETKLKDEIKSSLNLSDISSEQVFKDYFKLSPIEVIDLVSEDIKIIENTLINGVSNINVRNCFESVNNIGRTHYQNLRNFLEGKVNSELAYVIKCAVATENLHNSSSSELLKANSGIILEALALGGTMAAVIIPLEIVNHKFP